MKFTTRDLVTVAIFGALWGLVEMSVGTALKALHIPMSGMLLATVGITLALIGRAFVPRRGSTLFIGLIAAFIKLFSANNVLIGPMVGITAEALVVEIVLSIAPQTAKPRRGLFILAGAMGVLWVLIHPFVTNPLLFGRSLLVVWYDMLDTGTRLLGLGDNAPILILAALAALHLAAGVFAGWLGYSISNMLQTRLGRASSTPRPQAD